MESIGAVLTSGNGIPIAIIFICLVAFLLFMSKRGFFSYHSEKLTIGKSEPEVRMILLKQKEFLLQYCSYLTQRIISDLAQKGIKVDYVTTDYVVEKIVDEWLGWLIVNHITDDERYIEMKTQQARLIMYKAIGKVNARLLQNSQLHEYFENIVKSVTKDIVIGVLSIYKIEK